MQCGAGLCYQDIPNLTKYLALKKNEHFEVYLRYIISILINDGPEMLVNFDLIETKVIVFKGTRVN